MNKYQWFILCDPPNKHCKSSDADLLQKYRGPQRAVIALLTMVLTVLALTGEAQNRRFTYGDENSEKARVRSQLDIETQRGSTQEISLTAIGMEFSAVSAQQAGVSTLLNGLNINLVNISSAIQLIKSHAQTALNPCTVAGEVLHWNSISWSCAIETDPTAQAFAKLPFPGTCNNETAKLRFNTTTNLWECIAEADPTAQPFSKTELPNCGANQLLSSNGSGLNCVVAGQDISISETDPKVGANTPDQWCQWRNGKVHCDLNGAPFINALNSIMSCGATHKTWNGTTCIGAATNPIIATTMNFNQISAAPINSVITSNPQTVDAGGANLTVQATLSGPASAVIVRNGTNLGRSAVLSHGDAISLRFTTGSIYDESIGISINIGGVLSTWSVQTQGNPAQWRRVFLTKNSFDGNLGGSAGADAKCQTAADEASLGGSWIAALSTSTQEITEKIAANGGTKGWRLVDNRTVVLRQGLIGNPGARTPRMPPDVYIGMDQFGNPPGNWVVWYGGTYAGWMFHSVGVTLGGVICPGPLQCASSYSAQTISNTFHVRPHSQTTCLDWTSNSNGDSAHVLSTFLQIIPASGSSRINLDGSITYNNSNITTDIIANNNSVANRNCSTTARLLCIER